MDYTSKPLWGGGGGETKLRFLLGLLYFLALENSICVMKGKAARLPPALRCHLLILNRPIFPQLAEGCYRVVDFW